MHHSVTDRIGARRFDRRQGGAEVGATVSSAVQLGNGQGLVSGLCDERQLHRARSGVDDEDPHWSGQSADQAQPLISGSSCPCSRVYARASSRRSCIAWRMWPARAARPGHAVDDVDDEVEPVEVVEHDHVERRGGRALLLVAAHVQVVVVVPPIGEPMDEPRVAVVREDDRSSVVNSASNSPCDRPCGCSFSSTSRMRSTTFTTRTLSSGSSLAEDVDRRQRLERRHVAGAGDDHVRLAVLVVAGPGPDADAARAVQDRLVHRQPLRRRLLAGDDDVHVAAAAQAVVRDADSSVFASGGR